MNNKFKIMLSLILALTLVMGGVASAATMVFYDVDTKTSYDADMTDAQLEELIQAYTDGNEIAKVVNGKLVNYNAYKAAVAAVIIANAGKTNAEIAAAINAAMPGILAGLDEVVIPAPPVELDKWFIELSTDAVDNTILANGNDNTTVTIKIVDQNGVLVPENGIVIELITSHGSLASAGKLQRVTLQNGVGTIKLNSEFYATPQIAEVTAKLFEASQAQKDAIGKKEVILNVFFRPMDSADLVAPAVMVSAESNQTDRVTLFFDKDVYVEDFEAVLYNGLDPLKGIGVLVGQGAREWDVVGYLPVAGNPKAIVAILDVEGQDGPLRDNTWTWVNTFTFSDYGWSFNDTRFLLTDARIPELVNVEVLNNSMNRIRLEFSESISQIDDDNVLVDGLRGNDATIRTFVRADWTLLGVSVPYGTPGAVFVPFQDNRSFVDVGMPNWLLAGTHSVTISDVLDWAGQTDPKNVSTTQTLEFVINPNTARPTVEVVVESPEQIRMFVANSQFLPLADFGNTWTLQYKAKGTSAWTTYPAAKVLISDFGDEIVLETREDMTVFFKTEDTNKNYYNYDWQLHFDANVLQNVDNGLFNLAQNKSLNYVGSPLNLEDVISPKNLKVEQTSDFNFDVFMNEPVKYRNTEDGIDTPSEEQGATIPEVVVEFIGKNSSGTVVTIPGLVNDYGDDVSKDMVINVGEVAVSPLNPGLQALVDDSDYSEDWTLNVKNITDDVGNAAETVVFSFTVTKTPDVVDPDAVYWISETYVIGRRLYVQYTDLIKPIGGEESALLLSNYSINNQDLPAGSEVRVDTNSETEIEGQEGYTRVIIQLPEWFQWRADSNTLEVAKTLISLNDNEFQGFLDLAGNPSETRYQDVIGTFAGSDILGKASAAVAAADAITITKANVADAQALVDAAKALVEALPQSPQRTALLADLEDVQADIDFFTEILAVEDMFENLPLAVDVTLADDDAITEAFEAWDELDAAQQALVDPVLRAKAWDALVALNLLKAAAVDQAKVDNVKALIADLPVLADIDINDADQVAEIEDAWTAYNDLITDGLDADLTVSETNKINEVYNELKVLQASAALQAVDLVVDNPMTASPTITLPFATIYNWTKGGINPANITIAGTTATASRHNAVNTSVILKAEITLASGEVITKEFLVVIPTTGGGAGPYAPVTVDNAATVQVN